MKLVNKIVYNLIVNYRCISYDANRSQNIYGILTIRIMRLYYRLVLMACVILKKPL